MISVNINLGTLAILTIICIMISFYMKCDREFFESIFGQ